MSSRTSKGAIALYFDFEVDEQHIRVPVRAVRTTRKRARFSDLKLKPRHLERIEFVAEVPWIRNKAPDREFKGTDIELLRALVLEAVEDRYLIVWTEYVYITVSDPNKYDGGATGLEIEWAYYCIGTRADGKKCYVNGARHELYEGGKNIYKGEPSPSSRREQGVLVEATDAVMTGLARLTTQCRLTQNEVERQLTEDATAVLTRIGKEGMPLLPFGRGPDDKKPRRKKREPRGKGRAKARKKRSKRPARS